MENAMNITAHRPGQTPATSFPIQNLILAPEGWRPCVEMIADGFCELIGQHLYCQICGGMILGMQGHRFDCVTMVARRILVNEPLLHAQLRATTPDVYLRLDTAFVDANRRLIK